MPIAFQPDAFGGTYPDNEQFQDFDRFVGIGPDQGLETYQYLLIDFGDIGMNGIQSYEQGGLVALKVTIKDPSQVPPLLFDPTTVQISILDPSGTTVINLGTMNKISTGVYSYLYQTTAASPIGSWTIFSKVTSGSNMHQTIPQVGFVLV